MSTLSDIFSGDIPKFLSNSMNRLFHPVEYRLQKCNYNSYYKSENYINVRTSYIQLYFLKIRNSPSNGFLLSTLGYWIHES